MSFLGPLQLCPNGVYTEDENLFLAPLFLPFHFDLCIISPYGKPPIVRGLMHRSGNESHISGTSLRISGAIPSKTAGYPLRYIILNKKIGTINRCKIIFSFEKKKLGLFFLFANNSAEIVQNPNIIQVKE